jgi:hypothetical protein
MKTFLEFISEAEVAWHTGILKGSKKSPSSTATQKITQLGRQMTSSRTSLQKMKSAIAGSGEVAKVSDPRPETKDAGRTNTKIRGYASKPRDVVSRVGTTSDVQRTDLPAEPDVVTQHRYAKKGTAGGRGTNVSRTGRTYGTKG